MPGIEKSGGGGVSGEVLLALGSLEVSEASSCASATVKGESVKDAASRSVIKLLAVEERHRHKENLAECI
jgi:hypothetical protein